MIEKKTVCGRFVMVLWCHVLKRVLILSLMVVDTENTRVDVKDILSMPINTSVIQTRVKCDLFVVT